MSKQVIWTSKLVEEKIDLLNMGEILKNIENPFHEKVVGLRKSGLSFRMSQNEIDEYIKCKTDLHYFAENYCWIKGEKGEPVKIKLRDYQEEILDNFFKNRFNILMSSRQTGKCAHFNTIIYIENNNQRYFTRIGSLYYYILSKNRKFTFLEKVKIKLYDILFLLEKN
jgi:hypothetical protein